MSDIKFLVGLGNPGEKYRNTRHNVGFKFLDFLVGSKAIQEQSGWKSKFSADVNIVNIFGHKLFLVKPQSYMNCSGEPLQMLANFYKITASEILVCYDDLDLEFERLRLRDQGSSGGHNGIKSIETCFGSNKFPRLRIGIGRPSGERAQQDVSDWVLSNFDRTDDGKLEEVFVRALDILKLLVEKDLKTAQLKGKF